RRRGIANRPSPLAGGRVEGNNRSGMRAIDDERPGQRQQVVAMARGVVWPAEIRAPDILLPAQRRRFVAAIGGVGVITFDAGNGLPSLQSRFGDEQSPIRDQRRAFKQGGWL